MRYTLLEFINKKTENKFSFLKLKEVVYNKNSQKCVIFLLYPQTKDISLPHSPITRGNPTLNDVTPLFSFTAFH